jgi:hypothetical protein
MKRKLKNLDISSPEVRADVAAGKKKLDAARRGAEMKRKATAPCRDCGKDTTP